MGCIKRFQELTKGDTDIAGGKGASLGEMTNAKIPVPPGFVVCADAFERFAEETDLTQEIDAILKTVDTNATHTVEEASENIRSLIFAKEMPDDLKTEIQKAFKELNTPYVAVRSSATAEDGADHAWAGQLDSFLNTTEETLLENVRRCWASLFTPRAIFYRFEKDLHETFISVAVVVQKMVESEISGIAFSVHPVTEDHNQMIIEAGLGLGEAIVSGQITPDSYVVTKDPKEIIDINIATQTRALYRKEDPTGEEPNEWKELGEEGEKQVLTGEKIQELADIITTIENHYGFPCDIEWAYEDNTFYITQSRPITTLANTENQRVDIHHSNYQRLFRVGAMPYLIADIFAGHYKNLKCLLLFANNKWTSYLPKDIVQETLKEGVELYGDEKVFSEYKQGFNDYKKESRNYLESLVSKKELSKKEIEEAFEYLTKLFGFYIKTEFFYTDQAFVESKNNKTIQNNLAELDEIKNSGREYLNTLFFGAKSFLSQILEILEAQLGVSKEVLQTLSRNEVVGLFDYKSINEKKVEDRKTAYLILADGRQIAHRMDGDSAQKIIDSFESEVDTETDTLKGVTASRGVVRGKVRVIYSGYDNFDELHKLMDDMGKGEILVAETTSPELMPACKKAGAIITNQGGMMSHAAIVSREMKIPCVVGVENATEVLYDGDEVEVDANSGVIKIIK